MTTLVVVRKTGQIAIAADSLATFGGNRLCAERERSYDKIVRSGNTCTGRCGSATDQLVFENLLSEQSDLEAMYSVYDRLKSAEAIARIGVEAGARLDRNSSLPFSSRTVGAER